MPLPPGWPFAPHTRVWGPPSGSWCVPWVLRGAGGAAAQALGGLSRLQAPAYRTVPGVRAAPGSGGVRGWQLPAVMYGPGLNLPLIYGVLRHGAAPKQH